MAEGLITGAQSRWLQQAGGPYSTRGVPAIAPLYASHVTLAHPSAQPAYLRGAFVLSTGKLASDSYFLYSLATGLHKFLNWSQLLRAFNEQLIVDDRSPLLRFIPLAMRQGVLGEGELRVALTPLELPVFKSISENVERSLVEDRFVTHEVMSQMPSVRTVVYNGLKSKLDEKAASTPAGCEKSVIRHDITLDSPLVDWAFEYYLKKALPEREQLNYVPRAACGAEPSKSSAEIELEFVSFLDAATRHLFSDYATAISRYWNEPQGLFPSLKACVQDALSERLFSCLVQAQRDGMLSALEVRQVQACVQGVDQPHVERVLIHLRQTVDTRVELVAWYGFFIGGVDGTFAVMGDRGLEVFNNWSHFQRVTAPRFDVLLPKELESAPPLPDAHLSRYVARADRALWRTSPSLGMGYILLHDDLFSALEAQLHKKMLSDMEYVTEWLKTNTVYAKSYQAVDYASITLAVLDDALNIRVLLNPELDIPFDNYRWSTRFSLQETVVETTGELLEQLKIPLDIIRLLIEALDRDVTTKLSAFPTLHAFCKQRIAEQCEREGQPLLDLETIKVKVFAFASTGSLTKTSSMALIDAFIEHLTAKTPLPAEPALVQFERASGALTQEACLVLHRVLREPSHDVAVHFAQYLKQSVFIDQLTSGATLLDDLVQLKSQLLWAGGYYFFNHEKRLGLRAVNFISALQTFRVRSARPSSYYFVPDVHRVEVYLKSINFNARLENCFLITERGGLQSACAGHAVLWSPARKFESFDSVEQCQAVLRQRILDRVEYVDLTDTINSVQRATLLENKALLSEAHELFSFSVIEQDYLVDLESSRLQHHLDDALRAFNQGEASGLSSEGLQSSVDSYIGAIEAGFQVPSLLLQVDAEVFETALPETLAQATTAEKFEYASILQRYRNAVSDDRDYLHGIKNVHDYAAEALKKQLAKDFPLLSLDPNTLSVTATQASGPAWAGEIASMGSALSSTTQTLTAYALRGFGQLTGRLTLSTSQNVLPPGVMNEQYIKALVRKLDVGARYRTLLEEKLIVNTEEASSRFKLFCDQLPPQLLEIAFRYKLTGVLSDKAYRYIERFLNMPDGIARELLDGTRIIMRPLNMLSSLDAEPDTVKGMYLIGPETTATGPLVLLVTYSREYSIKEYPDEASFMSDVLNREKLQTQILARLDPGARRKYAHGGFKEPHITYIAQDFLSFDVMTTPAPVTISQQPFTGNVLSRLYKDNCSLLSDMAKSQSITRGEADWASFKTLLSLVMETVTLFLPARLTLPVTIWQTRDTLKAAVGAAAQAHWGEAVTEFVTSLLMLVAMRQPEGGQRKPAKTLEPSDETTSFASELGVQASFTAKYGTALEPYIEHAVSLSELQHDPLTDIYRQALTEKTYAAVRGRVFQISQVAGRWRIRLSDDQEGPALHRDLASQRWEIDIREPLPGGGPIFSRQQGAQGTRGFIAEATGMAQIRQLYPAKAVVIQEAHQYAVNYVNEGREVLKRIYDNDPISQRHAAWLTHFLGVSRLTALQTKKLDTILERIFSRLIKPSMNPLNSKRYVVGRSRDSDPNLIAFVTKLDSRKYIYLFDTFFRTRLDARQAGVMEELRPTVPPFDFNGHFRAVTLIHELCHQVAGAEDIAYINSALPYVEFLQDVVPSTANSATATRRLQEEGLSARTPRDELFRVQGSISSHNHEVNARIADSIVKLTGAQSLDQARDIFINDELKRADVILANADSLALIISRLGGGLENYSVVGRGR